MEKIGQIICTYRKLNGISQEELAGIVGVSAGAVSKWERDISLPDLDVLCNLADYFQITVDELLGRKKRKITDIQFFSGENEEIVKDVISSFLGRKYAGLILKKAQLTRDEQIEKIALMDIGVEDTGVLDSLLNTDDYHIQMMLRQMENDEFLQALAGTSKEIRIRLLQNLSDRLIGVIAETLQNVQGNVDDISEAQRKMLNIINDINVKQ